MKQELIPAVGREFGTFIKVFFRAVCNVHIIAITHTFRLVIKQVFNKSAYGVSVRCNADNPMLIS